MTEGLRMMKIVESPGKKKMTDGPELREMAENLGKKRVKDDVGVKRKPVEFVMKEKTKAAAVE